MDTNDGKNQPDSSIDTGSDLNNPRSVGSESEANPSSVNGRIATATRPAIAPDPQPPAPIATSADRETDQAQDSNNPSARRRKQPSPLIMALLGVGAVAAGLYGWHWWQYASTHEETDNAQVAGHLYQISSRISGTIEQVAVDDNQHVEPGQVLVKLDPKDYQVKVQQAQAALAVAQRQAQAALADVTLAGANTQAQTTTAQGNINQAIATISNAQANLEEAKAAVPAAQADLAATEADLQKSETDYNRYATLYEQGAISAQQRDSARSAYQVALAQRESDRQKVNEAQAKVAQAQQGVAQSQAQLQASRGGLQSAQATGVQTDVNRSQYEAATAEIAQAEAALKAAQLNLTYTTITAPAEGRVGRKTAEAGEQVQSGQALMAIVGDNPWIVANFKETQVDRMRPGEAVEIQIDALPGHTFTGHVASLAPASGSQFALLPPDNATGNFTKVVQRIPVKVVFDAESLQGYESQVTPGMSAVISVAL